MEVSRDLPHPFEHVPDNILRLFAVPDEQLQAVKSLADEEEVWDLPIPDNVQMTLLDILTNPAWTLDNLLDKRQLLYRTTVDRLEGYCEGKIKQLLLNLNEEQESYVRIRANGPVLIKGVAGSGKTTIGLYRANRTRAGKLRILGAFLAKTAQFSYSHTPKRLLKRCVNFMSNCMVNCLILISTSLATRNGCLSNCETFRI